MHLCTCSSRRLPSCSSSAGCASTAFRMSVPSAPAAICCAPHAQRLPRHTAAAARAGSAHVSQRARRAAWRLQCREVERRHSLQQPARGAQAGGASARAAKQAQVHPLGIASRPPANTAAGQSTVSQGKKSQTILTPLGARDAPSCPAACWRPGACPPTAACGAPAAARAPWHAPCMLLFRCARKQSSVRAPAGGTPWLLDNHLHHVRVRRAAQQALHLQHPGAHLLHLPARAGCCRAGVLRGTGARWATGP
jgi:hypothetical protein